MEIAKMFHSFRNFNASFVNDCESCESEEEYHAAETPESPNSMESLIPFMNDIQDILNEANLPNSIDLPQIVMVGSQSSGKSSVLESIVRLPIFPRGMGMVTRCPLVLQLIESKQNDMKYRKVQEKFFVEQWGEFAHAKGKIFTDYDEIRKEIEKQTEVIAGLKKGISKEAIHLKIYSPKVVTLTLVDLPGITKIPIEDQPEDIENQIVDLIENYIENEKSIILSVTAANTDISTSESLKYAKKVDPEGLRTLAILTKIDLMDEGTNAYDMLTGKIIPVKLGIIGTVNRSQQDIINKKAIDEQICDEKVFFEKNYKHIASINGIPYLSVQLAQVLKEHILKCLPGLQKEIKLIENNELLKSTGEEIMEPELFFLTVTKFLSNSFKSTIEGGNNKS